MEAALINKKHYYDIQFDFFVSVSLLMSFDCKDIKVGKHCAAFLSDKKNASRYLNLPHLAFSLALVCIDQSMYTSG